jgi:hypothetical protein
VGQVFNLPAKGMLQTCPRFAAVGQGEDRSVVEARLPGGEDATMNNLQEIEKTIRALGPQDLAALRDWFASFDAELWDRQLEQDEAAGRLNRFAEEALRDLREGRCTDR